MLLIGSEAMIGLYRGILTQALMSTLHVAGTFIGFQVGLTNAFSFDAVAQQSSDLTSFFTNVALIAIFATDLHHLMLRAVTDPWRRALIPGQPLPL